MKFDNVKIRQLMVRDGLRVKDVAGRIGMHPTAFSYSLKSGNTTRDVAERMAVIFNVPFIEIVADREDAILPEIGPDILKTIEGAVDRILEEKLAPLVTQMKHLNLLIDTLNGKL